MHNLAKVGVVGSNPIARSNFINIFKEIERPPRCEEGMSD